MAYMSQEKKKQIQSNLKKIIPTGWKWSIGVNHHSTLYLTIQAAPIDLVEEWTRCVNSQHRAQARPDLYRVEKPTYVQVNDHYPENQFDESLPIIEAILEAMNEGNHDRSDSQTDYFDVGWYVDLNLGRWNKPFQYLAPVQLAA